MCSILCEENTASTLTNNIPVQDHYIKNHGGTLVQHSSPLVYAMTFLNNSTVNFVDGLNLARREYTKFKNKFLSLCNSLSDIDYTNPVTGVDTILQNINGVKNNTLAEPPMLPIMLPPLEITANEVVPLAILCVLIPVS